MLLSFFLSFSPKILPFVADEIDPSTYSFTTALKGTTATSE